MQLKSVLALMALKSEFAKLAKESSEYLAHTIEQLEAGWFWYIKKITSVKSINEQYAPINLPTWMERSWGLRRKVLMLKTYSKWYKGNKDTELLVFWIVKK